MISPLGLLKLWSLLSSDVAVVKTGGQNMNWKSLSWWEHLALQIGGQAPTLAAVALGASNPVTIALSAVCGIATAVYTLAHAHIGASQAVQASGAAVSAAGAIDWSHPDIQSAVAAAQAVADSLAKIVASLPPPPAPPAPAPAPAAAPSPAPAPAAAPAAPAASPSTQS